MIIEGPAGVSKSWLACALGQKACRDNRSVLYQWVARMFGDLALARGDGRYPRLMRALGGVKLLILYDWGLEIAPRLRLWPAKAVPSIPASPVHFLTTSAIESVSIGLVPIR